MNSYKMRQQVVAGVIYQRVLVGEITAEKANVPVATIENFKK